MIEGWICGLDWEERDGDDGNGGSGKGRKRLLLSYRVGF